MQDEQISSWKEKHGKKVQHSILGRVKRILMMREDTKVLDKYVPTTKLCRNCGHIHEGLTLWGREYKCPVCGETEDRDVHAAKKEYAMVGKEHNRCGTHRIYACGFQGEVVIFLWK